MTKVIFSALAIILGVLLHAGDAEAQSPRTWVSGVGNDANPCTRAFPCLTFAGAYAKTSVGGEIDVLDSGDFGPLLIDHAITVANDGAGTAAVAPNGGSSAITIAAGPTDAVVLRGLSLNGAAGGQYGIYFTFGASLLVDHCRIEGFESFPGIQFYPGAAAQLWVRDTVLSNDGVSSSASVLLVPRNGVTATAHLERVQILHAIGNGIRADSTYGPGAIDVELRHVTVDAASGGSGIVAVSAPSGGPAVKVVADSVTSSHNAGYGFRAVGGTASIYLGRSVSEDNGVGVGTSNSGQIFSYGDNSFANNVSGDGVPPTPIGLK